MSSTFVAPAYGEGSLADLLPSVLGALGVDGESDVIGLPPARGYCVLLVDGLGWNQLRTHASSAPFLSSLPGRSITTPAPSTTATSITSLGTGLPPGRHGVVGYTSRLPGTATLLNALEWDSSVDPSAYQPYPDIFARGQAEGLRTFVVSRRRFAKSGLTKVALSGGHYLGADTVGERVAAVERAFDDAGDSRALVYAYESDLDATGHRHGPGSSQWRHELRSVDALVEHLADVLPPGCALIITGDHGMVEADPADHVDVDAIPELKDEVVLIGGEPRFRHVYTQPGAVESVAQRWSSRLGARALVRTREQAQADGWFGSIEQRVRERIGDVLVAARGSTVCLVPSIWPREHRMKGHHGSLTADEMLVPCLVVK